jgi:hypothetical protein
LNILFIISDNNSVYSVIERVNRDTDLLVECREIIKYFCMPYAVLSSFNPGDISGA